MKNVDCFDNFLTNTVNLSKFRLEKLDSQVTAIYNALNADVELGPSVVKKIPQGSWPLETIINPVGTKEVDADFLLQLKENPDWADDPQQYTNAVYKVLHNHSTYKDMPHGRRCRCVYVEYANSTHVDVVPFVVLEDGRKVIVNRDDNAFENTDPEGYITWLKEQDKTAKRNLRRVIRLMKYLRDHKGSFNGVKSVILTTLLGERVEAYHALLDPNYYGDVPTALLHIVKDLDTYLQAKYLKPSIADPSGSGVTFDHRWTQETYTNFRTRIHSIAADIEDAYSEEDADRSIEKWQALFGDKFEAPKKSESSSKFGEPATAGGTEPATSTSKSGRAG